MPRRLAVQSAIWLGVIAASATMGLLLCWAMGGSAGLLEVGIGGSLALATLAAACLATSRIAWSMAVRQLEVKNQQRLMMQESIDQAPDVVLWVEQDASICYANDAACAQLGYTREELLALRIPDVNPASTRETFAALLEEMTQGEGATFEATMRRSDGSGMPVEVSASLVKGARGPIICAHHRDISDRRRHESLREDQRAILQSIITGSQLGDVLTTIACAVERQHPSGRCSVLLMDAETKLARLGAGPNLPAEWNSLIDGFEIGPEMGSCGAAMYFGKRDIVVDVKTDPRCKQWRDCALQHGLRSCWSQPILSSTGQVLGTFAIYHGTPGEPDAHEVQLIEAAAHLASLAIEREQAVRDLRKSMEKYRRMVETTLEGVWQLDPEGRTTYVNKQMAEMLGVSQETLLSSSVFDFVEGEWLERACRNAARRRAGRREQYDCLFRRDDGGELWAVVAATPITDDHGEFVGTLAMLTDITERKRAERGQKVLMSELDHRVKNNLAIVAAITDRTADQSRDLAEFLAAFRGRIQAMAGTHALVEETHWIGASFEDVVRTMLRPFADAGTLRLRVDVDDLMLEPKAAATLGLVLHELATNAAKHGAWSVFAGRVEVTARVMAHGVKRGVELDWRESGGPAVTAPEECGFGSALIQDSVEHDLGGDVDMQYEAEGLVCTVRFTMGSGVHGPNRREIASMLELKEAASNGVAR